MDERNSGNSGFSLIELLVALAISAIVFSALSALLSTVVKGYTTQTTEAKLQSDANITMNQISDSIMEANLLEISKIVISDEGTSEESVDVRIKTRDHMVYYYNVDEQKLYMLESSTDRPGRDSGFSDYSLVCDGVTQFDIRVLKDSFKRNEGNQINGLSIPQIKVSMTIKRRNSERSVSKTAYVRNTIVLGSAESTAANKLSLYYNGAQVTLKNVDMDDIGAADAVNKFFE